MGLIYNYSNMHCYYNGVAVELKFRYISNIWKHIFFQIKGGQISVTIIGQLK